MNGLGIASESSAGGTFQISPDESAVRRLHANIRNIQAVGSVLDLGSASVSTAASSQGIISSVDLAISAVVPACGDLGALQN